MQVDVKTQGDIAIATLAGEIDGKTAPEVQERLLPVIADHRQCGVIRCIHVVLFKQRHHRHKGDARHGQTDGNSDQQLQ